jgi:hypothetical protein
MVTKKRSSAAAKKKTARRTAKPRTARRRKAAPAQDHEAMMAAWQEAMTPGDGHRRLEPLVGSWTARTTYTMGSGTPEEVSEGTSEHRLVLGGRYLEQSYRSTFSGMLYEGLGYTGYDNLRRTYVGTWMDTFGTGIMTSVGTGRPNDRAIDTIAESFRVGGKRVLTECKLRIADRDHHTFEMWEKAPNGRRYRAMRIEYTRR